MKGKRAMLLAGVGALAALTAGLPAQAQAQRAPVPVWGDRTGFDDYDWIDRADAISDTIGDAPPDTSFVFESGEPWAWVLEDGTTMIVEELPDGPHGYYFEPGTDAPFLVRDPQMSYGFIDGAVAVVYGADGTALSQSEGRGWLATAMRGYERGKRIKRAMMQRDRARNIDVGNWYSMSYLLFDWWDDWDYGLRRNPAWRRHHDGPGGAWHRHHWDRERQRRSTAADIFRRWGQGGYRGPAPGRFTPPKPGTQPPARWDHGGNGGPNGHRPPHDRREPRIDAGPQPDLGVTPGPGGVVRGSGAGYPAQQQQQGGAGRPGRFGGATGAGRPPIQQLPPEPQTPQAVAPVEVAPAPAPQPRPDRGDGGGRFHPPREMPEAGSGDGPPQPLHVRTEGGPARPERPSYTPTPSPSSDTPRSFTPRPERSFTPSPTPSPAPSRSYTPSPSSAPSYSTPTPSPAPSPSRSESPRSESPRSDSRPQRSRND